MINTQTFEEKHIRELQQKTGNDPILIERALYAFGLLEALVRVGMAFTFKGGSCLMLLLTPPRRLSTDIDEIISSKEYGKLSYLRKINLTAYGYLVEGINPKLV